MELINNTTKTLRDDLAVEIKEGSRLSVAAACFSIYAKRKRVGRKQTGSPKSKKIQYDNDDYCTCICWYYIGIDCCSCSYCYFFIEEVGLVEIQF